MSDDSAPLEGLEIDDGQHKPLRALGGELVLLTGPVGCGKTRFLRKMAGLSPFDGHLRCRLAGIIWPDIRAHRHWVRMRMDTVPALWLGQRVGEELGFGLSPKPDIHRMRHALDRWHLEELALNDTLAGLDRLQGVRLCLAAMSLASPKLALLDDPVSSLPLADGEQLRREIAAWAESSRCIVLAACNRWQEWHEASQVWHIASRGEWPQRMETENDE
ncbi:MAG TPA: ATP-binding cassette domain-containing protein [Mariprofundaceae bacterium]|nr:ATP-binding cassette domain-containing protein [Mariprofundaceae bacterium]